MKIKKVELQIITASEDKWLTQKADTTPINLRVISKKVYLGVNDTPDNWIEIDEATKAEFINAKQAAAEDERFKQ